eukprot:gene6133-6841_t
MSKYNYSGIRHWSERVNEAVVVRGPNKSFNLCIEGGSEYGQFVVIGDVLTNKVRYKIGSVSPGELILEINGKHIAGYTQTDAISLIKESEEYLELVTVYPGQGISRDLRKYLGTKFSRESVDFDLQETIRNNLYRRTVPCTTRAPKEGEVAGVDYEFLNVDQYLELEKSGMLLESGYFEGNYYGTPKPPKQPMTPGTGTIRRIKKKPIVEPKKPEEENLLPKNWEIAYTTNGEIYFVDHNTGKTQWEDPRKPAKDTQSVKSLNSAYSIQDNNHVSDQDDGDLPDGWEKVDDPKYGTYYIDHVNRKTQYDKPTSIKPKQNTERRRPSRSSMHSNATGRESEREAEPKQRPESSFDPEELSGETQRVDLRKGPKGFGFTIVGGEKSGQALQVNNIIRGGTANLDGRLKTGDTIIRLNGRSVLTWTHQDVVKWLQTTRVGEQVQIDVLKGRPLPFDPNDVNVKKVAGQTINRRPGSINGDPTLRSSNQSLESDISNQQQQRNFNRQDSVGRSSIASSQMGPSSPARYARISIVRGPKGFGFTIADSSHGQRIKEIIDKPRCRGLQETDLIVEINGKVVRNLKHADVVDALKACPQNQSAEFVVQRGGMLMSTRGISTPPVRRGSKDSFRQNRPKSMSNLDDANVRAAQQHHDMADRALRNSASTGNVIATTGESTQDRRSFDTRDMRQGSVDSAPYLRGGVDSAKAKSMPSIAGNDPYAEDRTVDHVINLKKDSKGFGFRIVGGQEEGTRVTIDTIVPNGAADKDGRLREGDVILAVNGVNVIDASHKKVITLMINAGNEGQVMLRIRRNIDASRQQPARGPTRETDDRPLALRPVPPVRSSSQPSVAHDEEDTRFKSRTLPRDMTHFNEYANQNREDPVERSRSVEPTNRQIVYGGREEPQEHPREPVKKPMPGAVPMLGTDGGLNVQLRARRERPKSLSDGVSNDPSNEMNNDRMREGLGNKAKSTAAIPNVRGTEQQQQQRAKPPVAPKPKVASKPVKEITLHRNENEGFGFVITSSQNFKGSVIGRIIAGSPADRSGQLNIDDRLLEVNGISVGDLPHRDIVGLVKNSGYSVKLRIARPADSRPVSKSEPDLNQNTAGQVARVTETVQSEEDRRREQYMRIQQEEEARRVEEDRLREIRERDQRQPIRPKSAPLNDPRNEQGHTQDRAGGPQKFATMRKMRNDSVENRSAGGQVQKVTVQTVSMKSIPAPQKNQPANSGPGNSDGFNREDRKSLVAIRKINPGEKADITLTKKNRGFGFSIRGGEGISLHILRIAEGGAAHADGRLKVGDEILEINGQNTDNMTHAEAVNMIRLCADKVKLYIRRPINVYVPGEEKLPNGQPSSHFNTLPRNGTRNIVERPKSLHY